MEADRAIQKLNGSIPEGATEPITVKFANNPSNNSKAGVPPLAAYLSPLARRFGGPIHHPAGRFRYIPLSPLARWIYTTILPVVTTYLLILLVVVEPLLSLDKEKGKSRNCFAFREICPGGFWAIIIQYSGLSTNLFYYSVFLLILQYHLYLSFSCWGGHLDMFTSEI